MGSLPAHFVLLRVRGFGQYDRPPCGVPVPIKVRAQAGSVRDEAPGIAPFGGRRRTTGGGRMIMSEQT